MERDGEEACQVEVATTQTEDVGTAIGSNNWLLMLLPEKPNQPRLARPNSRNKKKHKLGAHQRNQECIEQSSAWLWKNQQPVDSQELGKHLCIPANMLSSNV